MKTWFITGAARGLGARIAERALQAGDRVVATARDPSAVTMRFGQRANLLAARLDVTQPAQAKTAVQAALDQFGPIDVLVNNAGYGLVGAVEEASAGEIEQLFAVNVFGLLAVTRAVLPTMRARRSGHIINMSSIGGYRGAAGFGVYCATKFAVEGLTEALHAELAPLGIHVSAVEPGYFRTDFLDPTSLKISQPAIADYAETAGAVRIRVDGLNHQQPGDPAKLAEAVLRLANMPAPPVRLPLGADTVAAIAAKHARDSEILATWGGLAADTGHRAD
ncbi:oxidoreductase [Caulobacter sp. CCH9-E1]|jgi:NAD(P)-dependent dehydrogenase (short-subunit alcohol dehydrogenase family)|uniref:oxidoreductase n=1 Tax=Caulobacter sp. CCH9-E1 TaxID=1768768 RepID=UPI0008311DAF|nr:oxidoreductase [Caulobacter sp. CCH9-E1]